MAINLKNIILGLFLIGVASKSFVAGLQCYVCEDCNEYEDFKELHICGEIPLETTKEPVSISQQLTEGVSETPLEKSTLKPSITIDYLDSEEIHDEVKPQNPNQKRPQESSPQNTATQSKTTTKATTLAATTTTKKITSEPTQAVNQKPITEPKPVETSTIVDTTTEIKTTESTTTSMVVSPTKAKPVLATDYDDYMEYEDPVARSLLKINEPVCYMVKYQVNNTIITNRGCTTFINDNKFLTCQSLYNGAPMESCRVCSSNGCNKFLSDDDNEYDHGLPINTASDIQQLGFVLVFVFVLTNRFVI